MNDAAIAPRRPDVDFGWNIAGFSAGGLIEQLSLVLGLNALLLVAAGYYLLWLVLGAPAV
ncbi:MAG: hypothetical protein HYX46_14110 [Betaproteobacteria bacterium]|nr:hypothetical protein [Betaproteobacteria bacterium]